MKVLLLDNYDSFTYNLYDYLSQAGAKVTVVRNDQLPAGWMEDLPFDAIVLSPGPEKPRDAGQMMDLIARYHLSKPILGVCLGHQGIGEFFGARLVKAALPMHGKTSLIHHESHPLFANIPSPVQVMRYHSLLLESLPDNELVSIAETEEGEIMALKHVRLPVYGFQFHPESILSEYGLPLLKNWLALARQSITAHVKN